MLEPLYLVAIVGVMGWLARAAFQRNREAIALLGDDGDPPAPPAVAV